MVRSSFTACLPSGSPADPRDPLQYLVNHYLDVNQTILGTTVPVPATSSLEETNAVNGTGSLGAQAETCLAQHGYYPTFTLVDYYDVGNGSVFGASRRSTFSLSCSSYSAAARSGTAGSVRGG